MEAIKVKIGISNRHVHLTKETYDKLFDEEMGQLKSLSQTGEFVSNQVVTLKANDEEIAGVKILGPLRSYDQVEISRKDALKFKINPPVRASSDLEGAESITLQTTKGQVTINACIIAQRHIHMNTQDAKKYGVENKQKVKLIIDGPKSGIMDAFIKVSDNGVMEAHIDTDDANAFMLNKDDEGTLII